MKKGLALFISFLFVILIACSKEQPNQTRDKYPNDNPPQPPLETSTPPQATPELEATEESVITITFAGDSMMAGKVADIVKREGFQYPFQDSAPIFANSDITMLNLETALSEHGEAKEKEYTFRSDPLMAPSLKEAGVDIVSVANNHALDFGQDAFLDTLKHLRQAEVAYVGGGKNREEAYAPIRKYLYGKSISFFGFSRVLAEADWHAGKNHPGMASAYDPSLVYEAIATEINQSDYTIVYLHWGKELAEEPLPYQVELAHGLIDRGVDLVIGSHPHVLQGLEWYKGKLIAYSLGNFVFTTSRVAEGRQSGILEIKLKGEQITPRFIPMFIDRGAVWLAKDQTREAIIERMSRLSQGGQWNADLEYMAE
jgi:poly-gamma-glutamate capsule biosynthesis protein CapA/YwtB (metallophosphatase superfamily)